MGNSNIQGKHLLEEENLQIETDQFYNPPPGQDYEIAKQNFKNREVVREMMRKQNEDRKRGLSFYRRQVNRCVSLDLK